ncbi:MAG TPA: hypothetical protein VJJ76_00240 [archaeon]|nr:hypothetical protein [archaeon]
MIDKEKAYEIADRYNFAEPAKTFIFQIKAPSTPEVYQTAWQMLQELVAWFGDVFSKNISVSNC